MRCVECGAVGTGGGRCRSCGGVMPFPEEALVQQRPLALEVPLDRRQRERPPVQTAPPAALAMEVPIDRRSRPRDNRPQAVEAPQGDEAAVAEREAPGAERIAAHAAWALEPAFHAAFRAVASRIQRPREQAPELREEAAVLEAEGEAGAAFDALGRSLLAAPLDATPIRDLERLALALGRRNELARLYEELIDSRPEHPSARALRTRAEQLRILAEEAGETDARSTAGTAVDRPLASFSTATAPASPASRPSTTTGTRASALDAAVAARAPAAESVPVARPPAAAPIVAGASTQGLVANSPAAATAVAARAPAAAPALVARAPAREAAPVTRDVDAKPAVATRQPQSIGHVSAAEPSFTRHAPAAEPTFAPRALVVEEPAFIHGAPAGEPTSAPRTPVAERAFIGAASAAEPTSAPLTPVAQRALIGGVPGAEPAFVARVPAAEPTAPARFPAPAPGGAAAETTVVTRVPAAARLSAGPVAEPAWAAGPAPEPTPVRVPSLAAAPLPTPAVMAPAHPAASLRRGPPPPPTDALDAEPLVTMIATAAPTDAPLPLHDADSVVAQRLVVEAEPAFLAPAAECTVPARFVADLAAEAAPLVPHRTAAPTASAAPEARSVPATSAAPVPSRRQEREEPRVERATWAFRKPVAPGLEPAPVLPRLLSGAVDGVLLCALPFVVLALSIRDFYRPGLGLLDQLLYFNVRHPSLLVSTAVLVVGTAFVYLTLCDTMGGRTLGDRIAGLRSIDPRSGRPPALGRAAARSAFAIAGTLAFLAGPLWALFDPRGQALHDKLAGTVTVRAWLVR